MQGLGFRGCLLSSRTTANFRNIARLKLSTCTGAMTRQVALVEGDGIGPEISGSVRKIFEAAKVPIEWIPQRVVGTVDEAKGLEGLPMSFLECATKIKLVLKGPLATPIATGHRSLNLRIRKALDLFANVRPCFSIAGISKSVARYQNVNLTIIRENTEGEYSGIEHAIRDDCMCSVKIITDRASRRIARFAFDYAVARPTGHRRRVTVVHQMNSLPQTDGLFCNCCSEVSRAYLDRVDYDEMELEQVCSRLTTDPTPFDILLMPNLYGDIVSDLCAGMIGGLGLTASANMGEECAMFEAVHGSAPDIAGKDLANPTALLLSSLMMLDHLGLNNHSSLIRRALQRVITERPDLLTRDLAGSSRCSEFTEAICSIINIGEFPVGSTFVDKRAKRDSTQQRRRLIREMVLQTLNTICLSSREYVEPNGELKE